LLTELDEYPPISLETVASYQGITNVSSTALPNAGCLLTNPSTGRSEIRLRAGDPLSRRRFTGFHEVAHTFMPGYQLRIQWRCDPPTTDQAQADVEALCDVAAGEMLLPKRFVSADLVDASFGIRTVINLADRYEASLEASAHSFVTLWPEDCLLIVAEVANKPSEAGNPTAPAKLRVSYAWRRGDWPFIRRHKSFSGDDPLQRALAGEIVDETTTVDEVSATRLNDLHVSARLCPYTDARGTRHDRVLAFYRRRRPH
jgi:hypothetical protein